MLVHQLRLCIPHTGCPGSNPGWGTKSQLPQLKICMQPQILKVLYAAETGHSQKNIFGKNKDASSSRLELTSETGSPGLEKGKVCVQR